MADEPKTVKAFTLSAFKDTNFDHSGIEREFEAEKVENLPEGVFANYRHAGLARAATPDDIKAAKAA